MPTYHGPQIALMGRNASN